MSPLPTPRLLPALVSVLLLASCAEPAPPPGTPHPDSVLADSARAGTAPADTAQAAAATRPGIPLPELLAAGFDPPAGAGSLAVLDRLAPPLRVEAEAVPNRHVRGQMDTLRTYVYDGLRFRVYAVSGSNKEILQGVTVTGRAYTTRDGLRVGNHRTEVEAALGPPARMEDRTAVYEFGEAAPTRLRVDYRSDVVEQLEWSFYVD